MSPDISVYRDLHQLDGCVVDFWKRHQWHPSGDLDYVTSEYAIGKATWTPYVMVLKDQREVIACVFGKIQKLPLKLQFGYKVLSGPPLTTLLVHRSGFIGNWQEPLYEFVQTKWLKILASGEIDALLLRVIPLDSPLQHSAVADVPFLLKDHFKIVQEYWLLTQLQSFKDFLQQHPNLRKHFRYYGNRLNRVFSDKVEIITYHEPDQLERMLQDSEEIGRKTWQRKLGGATFLEDEERSRYEFYFAKGWCRGYILYLDHIPVAFVHGISYGDVFHVLRLGYDPSYRSLSVGTYLLMDVIKEFCVNVNIRTLDFNAGNSEAKRQYCDNCIVVSDIHVFAPRSRLWIPILLRLAAQGSHQFAKTLSHRMGFYQSIRKYWRHA